MTKYLAAWAVAAFMGTVPLAATAAPNTPFVAAGGGVWDAQGNNLIPEVIQTGTASPVQWITGSQPTAYGDFRAQFGTNRFVIQTNGTLNREVFGGSLWSDALTVAGAAQSGLLTLSASISGSIAGLGELGYALFVSNQPYDFTNVYATIQANHSGFWALALPNSTRVLFSGASNGCTGNGNWSRDCGHVPYENFQGSLNVSLAATIPVTFGQPLYVISIFSGGIGRTGGTESFLNSVNFGASASPGASLTSLSGTMYAAAIPEQPTWLLLIAGLLSAFAKGLSSKRGPCRPCAA